MGCWRSGHSTSPSWTNSQTQSVRCGARLCGSSSALSEGSARWSDRADRLICCGQRAGAPRFPPFSASLPPVSGFHHQRVALTSRRRRTNGTPSRPGISDRPLHPYGVLSCSQPREPGQLVSSAVSPRYRRSTHHLAVMAARTSCVRRCVGPVSSMTTDDAAADRPGTRHPLPGRAH